MCKIEDLVVVVVDSKQEDLDRSCKSLEVLGLKKILCVTTYQDAVDAIENEKHVDIVIADYNIEAGEELGLVLCSFLKKKYPSILFVLYSEEYTCAIAYNSLFNHQADDLLDKKREGEIEELMQKWVKLAQLKCETRDILYGSRQAIN